MYFWDISDLVEDLKQHRISSTQVKMYYVISPLLSMFNGVFFAALLFGHQMVEYSFHGWLKKQHPLLDFYNYWATMLTFLTIVITFGGIYMCYRANKRGDGKYFWNRLACLSFPINLHITVYTIVVLAIGALIAYFF